MRTPFARSASTPILPVALATALSVATSGATPQPQQQPPPPGQQPPVFRTEANFVRVDVYPMKGGQPLQGLTAEDFELFEDGVLQKIERVEHVQVRPAGAQSTRIDPGSQREALQQAANPRNRVFVIFLDIPNVSLPGAHTINEPLIRLIDRILGPDDLVGVMTPAMSASQVVLGRKTQVIEDSLRRNWAWGTRFTGIEDKREFAYQACYPPTPGEAGRRSGLAAELIRRKRERATLEALEDLVRYLHGVREERKAILTVTEGWLLYRPNDDLMKLRGGEEPPGRDPIVVGPTGQPGVKDPRVEPGRSLTKGECDTDRMRLAAMDNERFMRDLIDDANRANASFYMIDPRGLAAADTPVAPIEENLPLLLDQASLRTRLEAMRTLALNTDGLAVTNSNDLDSGLKRISDDLTSYYLLGYYSTNAKPDGTFRRLKVRVKQPGVEVRARRGYRAATLDEVTAARTAADAPAPSAAASALDSALGALSRIRVDAPFRINAVALSAPAGTTVWIAGEILDAAGPAIDFAAGGTAEIDVTAGTATQAARLTLKPGEKRFLTRVTLPPATRDRVEVRVRLSMEGASTPMSDAVQTDVHVDATQPLLYRRGPSTGNRVMPAADFRFSRSERVRLEIPLGLNVKAGAARMLDRTGQPLRIPVTVREQKDEDTGQRWLIADVALAALAAGDYAIEIDTKTAQEEGRVLTAIRVTR